MHDDTTTRHRRRQGATAAAAACSRQRIQVVLFGQEIGSFAPAAAAADAPAVDAYGSRIRNANKQTPVYEKKARVPATNGPFSTHKNIRPYFVGFIFRWDGRAGAARRRTRPTS